MTREPFQSRPPARRHEPLGLLLGTDDGLLQVVPGAAPERGIDGPRIVSVDAREGLAAAAGPDGVWVHVATAGGGRWRQVWQGDARLVQIEGDTIYLGTGDGRILLSEDEGFGWTPLYGTRELFGHGWGGRDLSAGLHPAVTGVAEVRTAARNGVPATGGIVVAFDGGGAWFTPNLGGSWLRRGEGLDGHIHRLYRHPDLPTRLYATTDTGLYRSTDEGHTWVQSLKDLDRSWGGSLAVLPGPTDTLVLSLARGREGAGALFRSVNAGLTWSRVLLGPAGREADEWPAAPAVVCPREFEDVTFVAAGTSLYASHDAGRSWTPLADALPLAHCLAASL
ncbi:MAG: WD40/YVTN/BNR-like repeat-containing protein [Dehalococcoidia bacterium]